MSQTREPAHTAAMGEDPHQRSSDVLDMCLNARLDTDVHLAWIDDLEEFERRTGIRRSTEMDLYWAVRQNNVPLVGKLLTENQNSNSSFRWKVKGGSREFFQFPLHRAVQTGNPELVELLLQHGSDPNSCDSMGCTPLQLLFLCNIYIYGTNVFRAGPDCCQTDPDIARMWLEGATRIDEEMWCSLFRFANRRMPCRWSFMGLLLLAENSGRNRLLNECRDCDNDNGDFFRIVIECGQGDSNGRFGYEVLEHCLKAGVEQHILKHSLQLAIKQWTNMPTLKKVLLLIKAGVDVNAEWEDNGQRTTPFHFILNEATILIDKYLKIKCIKEFQSGELDTGFSILWLLIKSGSRPSGDLYSHLGQIEVSLRSIYDTTHTNSLIKNWSCRRHSAVLGHLQRCLDIIREIQPPSSLLELSRIVVQRALGPWSENKVQQLQLPRRIKETLNYHDFQAIVDGVAKYHWTYDDMKQGRISPFSSSSEDSDDDSFLGVNSPLFCNEAQFTFEWTNMSNQTKQNVLHFAGRQHFKFLSVNEKFWFHGSVFLGTQLMIRGLTLIPAWISNYIQYEMWDRITNPFPNFDGKFVSCRILMKKGKPVVLDCMIKGFHIAGPSPVWRVHWSSVGSPHRWSVVRNFNISVSFFRCALLDKK